MKIIILTFKMADSISHKNIVISLVLTIIWCTTLCRNYHYTSILNVILDIIYVIFIHFPIIGYRIVDVENFTSEVAKVFWVGGEIIYVYIIATSGGMLQTNIWVPVITLIYSIVMMKFQHYLE